VETAGDTAATCTRFNAPTIPSRPLTARIDHTPAILGAVPSIQEAHRVVPQSIQSSVSHVSSTPPPAVAQTQNTTEDSPYSPPQNRLQEIPVSPTKAVDAAPSSQVDEKQTTEYTWPDSLMDVEMTSGSEPDRTTLLPDKAVHKHPAVQQALTSLALGRTVEQDGSDIMTGAQLPIISDPLLPSLIPLNEEESLLFSNIRPLQGAALIRAAGISAADLDIVPAPKGKKRSNSWTIPRTKSPVSGQITPHTQEPTYDTQSTLDTYKDLPFSQNLRRMASAFPTMTEEHLSLTLEKHENDLPTALAWMQTIVEMKHLRRTLMSAYPTADVDEVESVVKLYKGDFMLSPILLGDNHEPASSWVDFSFSRRRGVMDIGTDAPEVVYDDPAGRSFENQWWRTFITIRWHRVSHSPAADALWPKLAPVAVAPRPISHRFLQYVNDLGNYHTDRPRFSKAVGVLRAQDEFTGLVALIGEPQACFDGEEASIPAVAILHILVGDGLASPSAATWLALSVFKDRDSYNKYVPLFYGFPAIRRKVWNDRNVHMALSEASRKNSAAGSRIDASAAWDTYMSAVPGTIKYALEKQRDKASRSPKKKADKSSTGSRGSKKSRRIRGISPRGSIPEEEEEQGDAVGDAPGDAVKD